MFFTKAPRKLSLRIVAGAIFLLAANGCVNLEDAAGLLWQGAPAEIRDHPKVQEVLGKGENKASISFGHEGLQVDLRALGSESYGAAHSQPENQEILN